MREQLLAFRLRRLVAGELRVGDWPALARVLRRSHTPRLSISSIAVSLHRPLHVQIMQPVVLRLGVHMTSAGQPVTLPARAAPRLIVRTFNMRASERLVSPRGLHQGAATLIESRAPTLPQVVGVPHVTTVVSHFAHSSRDRVERWLALRQQLSLRPVIANAVHTRIPTTTAPLPPVEFPSPRRILSRPIQATAPAVQTTPPNALLPTPDNSPRYWTESRPAIPQPDLNLLTERVLRTVDQRLVAARERLSHESRG